MIKLVAFDWNGTLFADTIAIFEADNEVIKFLGVKPVTFKTFLDNFDVPVKRYYMALGAKEKDLLKKSAQIARIFHSYYMNRETKIRTRAHTRDLLKFLSKQKIDSIIISNHVTDRVNFQLERLKLKTYFKSVLARADKEEAFKERTKGFMLKAYMKKSGLKSSEVLVVGDNIEEVHLARELGTKVAAITHGNCSNARLKAAKPDYLINNLKEIIEIIKNLKFKI